MLRAAAQPTMATTPSWRLASTAARTRLGGLDMDADRFDSLTRALTAAGSRRRARALAVSGALAPLFGLGETDARDKLKKCKKIDNKHRRKKCIKKAKRDNDNLCQDGVKNGGESDVDCGGGTCPRCAVGQICASRNDCISGRCDVGTCK